MSKQEKKPPRANPKKTDKKSTEEKKGKDSAPQGTSRKFDNKDVHEYLDREFERARKRRM